MAVNIQGNNYGIAVDGDLNIEKLEFEFGKGVKSVSGVHQKVEEAEVIEEIPVVDGRKKVYPEITDAQTNFFNKIFFVTHEVNNKVTREAMQVPLEYIMHTIYDHTGEWNPSEKTSVHKWKVLYETLRRMKYFSIDQKQRYADFVKAVVSYCFPDVQNTYSNNISKSYLSDDYGEWSSEDKKLYVDLKKSLENVN